MDKGIRERRFMVCIGQLFDSIPKVLRALIKQRCKPDLQTYITNNQDKIKCLTRYRPYIETLSHQTIDEWDINLLVWFLTQVATGEVLERDKLCKVRIIRNELAHNNNAQLEKQQYDNIVNDIKSILSYFEMLKGTDFDLKEKIKFIKVNIPDSTKAIQYEALTEGEQYQAPMMGKQDQLVRLMSSYHYDAKVEMEGIIRHSETGIAIKTADAVESRSSKPGLMSVQGKQLFEDNALELIMNPMMLPSYLLEKGMASKESIALIEWLQAAAEAEYSTADLVWIGCDITLYAEKIPTIVAMYKTFPKDLQFKSRFLSFEVIQKEIGDLSPEAKYVAEYERKENMQFSPEETENLQKCLDSNTERLMNEHSNLLIISTSKVKSTRYGQPKANLEHKACVVLYVHMKGIIPIREEPFPAELDGFPVDVRESMCENYGKPDDYFVGLLMGSKIQTEYKKTGTLGGFVKLKSGGIGCFTCYHLFRSSENQDCFPSEEDRMTNLKKKVYQPSDRTDAFGEVIQCIDCENYKDKIGVDAALIEITNVNRLPSTGRFPNAESPDCGFSDKRPMIFDSGEIIKSWDDVPKICRIVKYGATSEHTIGVLNQTYISSRGLNEREQDYNSKTPLKLLRNQIEVWSVNNELFAEPGDSGSLVFAETGEDQPQIRALGMLVRVTTYDSAIVTPIWAVLGMLRNIESSSSLLCFPQLHSAASSDPDSEGDSDEDERNNALVDKLKSDVTTMKTEILGMADKIEKLDQNHVSIKGDIATLHKLLESGLAAIMQQLSSNVPNGDVMKENNTEGETGHRNNRDTN